MWTCVSLFELCFYVLAQSVLFFRTKFHRVLATLSAIGLSSTIGLDKQIFWRKIVNIFLPICFNICFRCSKEPSQQDGSFEYPQHMFWLRNKKVNFFLRTLQYLVYTCLVYTCF